jgi:hypothetical protein
MGVRWRFHHPLLAILVAGGLISVVARLKFCPTDRVNTIFGIRLTRCSFRSHGVLEAVDFGITVVPSSVQKIADANHARHSPSEEVQLPSRSTLAQGLCHGIHLPSAIA